MLFHMTGTSRHKLEEKVSTALYQLVVSVAHGMPRDISRTSVATLNTLEMSGPLRITRLADLEGVTQPTMTTLVDKLELSGMVQRMPDSTDRRATLIDLTEQGRSYLRQRRTIGTERLAQLIGQLPEDLATLLATALPAISELNQSAVLLEGTSDSGFASSKEARS